jgi:hypothetical protein
MKRSPEVETSELEKIAKEGDTTQTEAKPEGQQ